MLRTLLLSTTVVMTLSIVACGTAKTQASTADQNATGKPASSSNGGTGTSNVDPGTGTGTNPGTGTTTTPAVDPATNFTITTNSVDISGETRQYVLAVPKNLDPAKQYPLIVALHGDGGNANEFVAESGLPGAVGDGAILAFTDQVLDLFTSYGNNHDQRLVRATIEDVKVKMPANVDTARIWGFGYSKGAFMLNELACRKPGLFTAMAIHAGGAPVAEQDDDGNVDCPNAAPVPMFITEGATDDPDGGEFEVDYWAGIAGCGGDRTATTPAMCGKYNDCGTAIEYCVVPNQGHFPLYSAAGTDSWTYWNALNQ